MANSILTYTGASGFGPYAATFTLGKLRDEYVKVRVNEEVDGLGAPLYRSIEWISDTLLNITSGTLPTVSDTVQVIRTIPVDTLIHDYDNGAVINEENLDESNLQTIMLVHQFIDGRITSALANDLDMGSNKITNLADGTVATDAVNLGQLQPALDVLVDATAAKVAAETAAVNAALAETNAEAAQAAAEAAVASVSLNNETTTNPTINDDVTLGYSAGSIWMNTTTDTGYLCTDATDGAAVWLEITAADTLTPLSMIVGDAGTEGSGITIAGVPYESSLKVSDIDGTNYAQTILHRHSTTLEPLIVGARSNSNTSSHAAVTAGQNVFSVYGAGVAGTDYKLFGSLNIGADTTGTIDNTSAPGKFTVSVTPDGAVVPVTALSIANTGVVSLAQPLPAASGGTGSTTAVGTAAFKNTGTSGNTVPLLDGANAYSAAQKGTPVSLTQAATIAVNLALGNHFYTTMTGNRTLGQPTNMSPGQSGTIEIIQDGTGSRTLVYHADWLFAGGADPVLSTAAGSTDLLCYQVNQAGTKVFATLVKGFA